MIVVCVFGCGFGSLLFCFGAVLGRPDGILLYVLIMLICVNGDQLC